MKKSVLLILLTIAFTTISCEKNEIDEQVEETQQLPHYDDTNSQLVDWDDFPEELKNATPIKNKSIENKAYSYSVGPFGGGGGGAFNVNPPSGTKIYAIAIRSGKYVNRLVIYYRSPSGTIYVGADRGRDSGTYHINFFSTDEHITGIAGRSGRYLDRLSIYTNKKSFSYGGNGGSTFNVSIPPVGFHVLGFYGRSGWWLDRIGFHIHTL